MLVAPAVGACGNQGSAARAEMRRAVNATYPSTYEFVDTVALAPVLECAGAETTVRGLVNEEAGTAAFGHLEEPFPEVVWTTDASYVRSAAVMEDASAEWLRLDRDAPEPALVEALAPLMASYALADRLPTHPQALARAATDYSSSLEFHSDTSEPRHIDAEVDAQVLNGVGAESSAGGSSLALRFVLTDQGLVASVAVANADLDESAESGFHLSFDWAPALAPIEGPTATRLVDPSTIAAGDYRPEPRGPQCQI